MTSAAHRPSAGKRRLTVWRFADGKPGHDNQSRGLLAALGARRALDVYELEPLPCGRAVGHWLRRRYPEAHNLPAPDVIVGAGHGTHGSMLAARRARGGRIVVLMCPTLPLAWFDLCIVPLHDRAPQRQNVLATQGVLNAIQPVAEKDPDSGLILIGGPSRHYGWDETSLLNQVRDVIAHLPAHWIIATSRRTPPATEQALASLAAEDVRVVPWRETRPDWLPRQLSRATVVWITADSVSMIYEALTAGAACGLLEVPAKGRGRVRAGVDRLVSQRLLTTYEQWQRGAALQAVPETFNEAERCARWIEQHWWDAN